MPSMILGRAFDVQKKNRGKRVIRKLFASLVELQASRYLNLRCKCKLVSAVIASNESDSALL